MLQITFPGQLQELGRFEQGPVAYYVYEGVSPRRPPAVILCALGPGLSHRSMVSFARQVRTSVRGMLRRRDLAARVEGFEGLLRAEPLRAA